MNNLMIAQISCTRQQENGEFKRVKEQYIIPGDTFSTVGNLFYFVTKVRDSDIPYKNIFIEKMDITDETLEKMKQSVVVEKPPVLDIPVFGNTLNTIGWGDEDSPF